MEAAYLDRCPSTNEWIKKLAINICKQWNITKPYNIQFRVTELNWSHIKNTFESVLMQWMNLEPVIESEISQKEKNVVY